MTISISGFTIWKMDTRKALLTELHAEDMAEIPRATSTEGTAQDRQRLGEKLASDAATAQVMRALNVYRARLGYGPQEGGDGTEAAGGDM